MSKVVATVSAFVGHKGQSVWVGEGDEYDDADPLVKAFPKHFRVKDEPKPALKRRTTGAS